MKSSWKICFKTKTRSIFRPTERHFRGFYRDPVSAEDRDTRSVFGEYIHVYDMQQATEDGATVAIYYESRLAKDSELPTIDNPVDEWAEDEEDDQQSRLQCRWAALEKAVGVQLAVHIWPFSADRHNGVCWSSRMQTVGQHGCKWLVSGNANEWSSPCNYASAI